MEPLKILIVEDETITAMDLRETLEDAGHTVIATVANLEEALLAVKNQLPDLALIDIHLEGSRADGITIAKQLLLYRSMPIIYLTANSDEETFQSAKETLPAAYLLKPFRHHELKLQIELAYHFFQANIRNATGTALPGQLYLPIGKGFEKINMTDIRYLKADGAYVKVFTFRKDSPHHVSTNLGHLVQYFTAPNFYRLSRSLLINLDHLERLESNCLYMINDETAIPIPSANRKELMRKLTVVRTK